MEKLLTRTFIWVAMFPYISPVQLLKVDTQPWALAIAALSCAALLHRLRLAPVHLGFLVLLIGAVAMFWLDRTGVSSLRNVANYASLFFIAVMTSHALRVDRDYTLKAIDIALMIWLVVGLAQRLVDRDLLTFLLAEVRTSATRGVVGLAPEPTFYASMVLLMVLLRAPFGVRAWHLATVAVVTFLVASSAQVALIVAATLGVALVVSLFTPRYLVAAWALAIVMTGAMAAIYIQAQDTRLGQLITLAAQNPTLILMTDHSANERFIHIFVSFYSVVDRGFLPNGIWGPDWLSYVWHVQLKYPDLLWVPQSNERIYSGFGALIFQMGFLSFLVCIPFAADWRRWSAPAIVKLPWLAAFALLLVSMLPLAHPLIGAICGALALRSREPAHPARLS